MYASEYGYLCMRTQVSARMQVSALPRDKYACLHEESRIMLRILHAQMRRSLTTSERTRARQLRERREEEEERERTEDAMLKECELMRRTHGMCFFAALPFVF